MSKAIFCRPPQPVTMSRTTSRAEISPPVTWERVGEPEHCIVDITDSRRLPLPLPGGADRRRRGSGDSSMDLHFLQSCGTCRRRLGPGRDIYIYKGDAAFCSLDCREQRMRRDTGNPSAF